MADTKISALTASTTPLAGSEVLPIVQSGTTKQVSVANLTAGRAISASQLTLTAGNLIVPSGNGVDFSATPNTGTSELLDDYEEGTWTPTISGSVTPGTGTYFNQTGRYTKIGRLVFIQAWINCGGGHTGTGNMLLTGLPFTSASGGAIFATFSVGLLVNLSLSATNVITLNMLDTTSKIDVQQYAVGGGSTSAVPLDPTCAISFSGCYIVD